MRVGTNQAAFKIHSLYTTSNLIVGVYFNIWRSILMYLCTPSLSINISWLEREKEVWKYKVVVVTAMNYLPSQS